MAFSLEIGLNGSAGGVGLTNSKSYSAGLRADLDEAVADGSTDLSLTYTLDVSAVKAFYMVADVAMLIETNNGTTPDDSITLVADVPYIWTTDSYDTFQLATDVTAIFATNSSGTNGTLKILSVVDPTP